LILVTGFNNSATKPVGDTYIYEVSNSQWNECTLTYSNKPVTSESELTLISGITFDVTSQIEFDIGDHLKANFLSSSYYSLMVHTTNTQVGSWDFMAVIFIQQKLEKNMVLLIVQSSILSIQRNRPCVLLLKLTHLSSYFDAALSAQKEYYQHYTQIFRENRKTRFSACTKTFNIRIVK